MREKNNTFQEIADTLNKVGIPSRFGGRRVGGDKGCGWILPKGHDQRTDPQTVTRLAGQRHKTSVLRVAMRHNLE